MWDQIHPTETQADDLWWRRPSRSLGRMGDRCMRIRAIPYGIIFIFEEKSHRDIAVGYDAD